MNSDDWAEVRLGDLVDDRGISYGIVQPGSAQDDGVPIIRVNNLHDGRIDVHDVKRVSPEVEAKYARTRLRGGEVLVSLVGSLGQIAVVPPHLEGWNVARAVAVVPVRNEVGADWLTYALRSPALQHRMRTRATTTVQATLNLQDVRELPIPLPPKSDRQRVASILRSLDDKIELNRRMIRTLESTARAIFRSWVVDSDPSRHGSEGRGTSTLGELVEVSRRSASPDELRGHKVDHYSIPAFDDGRMPAVEDGVQIKSNKFVVDDGMVLVSRLNPRTPRVWMPQMRGRRAVCSTEFMALMPRVGVSVEFLYAILDSEAFGLELTSRVTGTSGSHQRVRPSDALSIDAPLSTESQMQRFTDLARPMLGRAIAMRQENAGLAALRDALLPELLAGRLKLRPREQP